VVVFDSGGGQQRFFSTAVVGRCIQWRWRCSMSGMMADGEAAEAKRKVQTKQSNRYGRGGDERKEVGDVVQYNTTQETRYNNTT
jgi:hypothetical protein